MELVTELFGVKFYNGSMSELVSHLLNLVRCGRQTFVHTANVDHLMLRDESKLFRNAIERADVVTADGMPIVWASRILRRPLRQRIAGSDLVYCLLEAGSHSGLKFFFLGSTHEACTLARKAARQFAPGVNIVGHYSPAALELTDGKSSQKICDMINESGANTLFVALGAPKQEIWICDNLSNLNTVLNIGVGASIDFLAGKVPRAPQWIRDIGFEWVYRLSKEPKRLWRRYLIRDVRFIFVLISEVITSKRRKRNDSKIASGN